MISSPVVLCRVEGNIEHESHLVSQRFILPCKSIEMAKAKTRNRASAARSVPRRINLISNSHDRAITRYRNFGARVGKGLIGSNTADQLQSKTFC